MGIRSSQPIESEDLLNILGDAKQRKQVSRANFRIIGHIQSSSSSQSPNQSNAECAQLFLVENMIKDGYQYAMKQLNKFMLYDKREIERVHRELNIQSLLVNTKYVVNLLYAFQDLHSLYMVYDYKNGPDLAQYLKMQKVNNQIDEAHACNNNNTFFKEKGELKDLGRKSKKKFGFFDVVIEVKMTYFLMLLTEKQQNLEFIFAYMLLSLEYIHKNNIILLGLRPETILFDDEGYPCISGFQHALMESQRNNHRDSAEAGQEEEDDDDAINNDLITPYLAPEVLLKQKPSFEADYYSLGMILYEIVTGEVEYLFSYYLDISSQINEKLLKLIPRILPAIQCNIICLNIFFKKAFTSAQQSGSILKKEEERQEIIKFILNAKTQIRKYELPEELDAPSADLVNKLILKKVTNIKKEISKLTWPHLFISKTLA